MLGKQIGFFRDGKMHATILRADGTREDIELPCRANLNAGDMIEGLMEEPVPFGGIYEVSGGDLVTTPPPAIS